MPVTPTAPPDVDRSAHVFLVADNLRKQGKPRNSGKQKDSQSGPLPPARISSEFTIIPKHLPPHLHPYCIADGTNDIDSLMDLSFDPSYPFGSQAANLEYSMLSAILGNPASDAHSANDIPSPMLEESPASVQAGAWASMTPSPLVNNGFPPLAPELTQQPNFVASSSTPTSASTSTSYIRTIGPISPSLSNDSPAMQMDSMDMLQSGSNISSGPSALSEILPQQSAPEHPAASGPSANAWRSAGDSVYSQVVTGYDYTQGYHFLMRFLSERSAVPFPFLSRGRSAAPASNALGGDPTTTSSGVVGDNQSYRTGAMDYPFGRTPSSSSSSHSFPSAPSSASYGATSGEALPAYSSINQNERVIDEWPVFSRFEKNDILRVVRALAIFRPSLIALQMPMSEQDEIFVERALQRSLLVRTPLMNACGDTTFSHNLLRSLPS